MHALARMLVVSAPATMFEFTHVGTNLYICQFLLHGFDLGLRTEGEECYPYP